MHRYNKRISNNYYKKYNWLRYVNAVVDWGLNVNKTGAKYRLQDPKGHYYEREYVRHA